MICAECRFWRKSEARPGWDDQRLYADCQLFSDDPNISAHHRWIPLTNPPEAMAIVSPFAGSDGGTLVTRSDFGCVQFEKSVQGEKP